MIQLFKNSLKYKDSDGNMQDSGVLFASDGEKLDQLSKEIVDLNEEKVGVTQQTFTDEQKAQARANIGVRDEGVYELIDTITLTEDAALDLSAEPDGTPYAFDALFISVNVKVGSGGGDVIFNFENSNADFARAYITAPTSQQTYHVIELCIEKGRWVSKFGGSTNGSITVINMDNHNRVFQLVPKSYGYNYVRRVFTKFTFAAGSTFKIYAIRHKGV